MYTQLWGDGMFRPHRVARFVSELPGVPFDYIICANKNVRSNNDTIEDAIRPAVLSKTALVSLQNGIHVEEPLKRAFGRNSILSAICYVSCQQTSPGVVRQGSHIRPHAFHIGAFDHRLKDPDSRVQDRFNDDTERDASKVRDLVSWDAKFREVKDINTERWAKLVINGSWNPVAALTGCDTRQILHQPDSLALAQRLAEEIYEVAVKSGANLPPDLPRRTLSDAASAEPFIPSMLQDARHGREMEVEPICGVYTSPTHKGQKLTGVKGNLLRQASVVDVSVPTMAAMYERLQGMETLQRGALSRNEMVAPF